MVIPFQLNPFWSKNRALGLLIRALTGKTLTITQDDIDRGVRQDAVHCPAARAVARLFPTAKSISIIGGTTVNITFDDHWERWSGGERLLDWIRNYDGLGTTTVVTPEQFDLRIQSRVIHDEYARRYWSNRPPFDPDTAT